MTSSAQAGSAVEVGNEWRKGAPPQVYDRVYEVRFWNNKTRRVKRDRQFDWQNLVFVDCTHPMQNIICDHEQIVAHRPVE